MENFLRLKPKDIKLLKESVQKIWDINPAFEDYEEPTEDDVIEFMELADFFQDISEDISQKVKDLTGYESEEDMEEAEEDDSPETPVFE